MRLSVDTLSVASHAVSASDHFEDLLTDLAACFVNVEPAALDDLIVESLRRIVLFLEVDRSTLGRFSRPSGALMTTHSWAKPGIEPIPSPLPEDRFPVLAPRLRAGQALVCDALAELPPDAQRDRESLERFGLRSIAAFPLTAAGEVIGWLSFGSVQREHRWTPGQVRRLRLIAGVFANALLRQRRDVELAAALAENLALRERVEAENAVWREEVLHCHELDELVGRSPALRGVLRQVEQVAATDSTVLILGETGTGKDLLATAIHRRSRRAERPLIRVNCAALPASLIESELFGHEKGAFTGAISRKLGRFELADGGTIFLDEIGELPLELQAKLLRVLQSGELERLGSAASQRVDARVIAATNRDLEGMARNGGFRPDLFYRLGVFPIVVPPLRDRKEDIAMLTAYFVERLRAKLDRHIAHVPDEAIRELMAYDWPGNVRELENIVERSMILSTGPVLRIDGVPRVRPGQPGGVADSPWRLDERTLAEVERDHIRAVCERCGWRISGRGNAAERLGLHPNTLRSRMQKLGVARPPRSAPSRSVGGEGSDSGDLGGLAV